MKLKSYVNRKRLAIELVLFDIIAIQMEYDTWDFRYHNDDHSIISCIINAI